MLIPLLYLISSIFTASVLFLTFRVLFAAPADRRPRTAPKTLPPQPREAAADYEVFLSFRGWDTRTGFTDHLHAALTDAGVAVFRDDNELQVGEEIGPDLLEAITRSKISIPIISPNYGNSKWCMVELAQMVECKHGGGHVVLPLFYKVEPGDVQDVRGVFGEGFEVLARGFEEEVVQGWRNVLREVGSLKGWESQRIANGYSTVSLCRDFHGIVLLEDAFSMAVHFSILLCDRIGPGSSWIGMPQVLIPDEVCCCLGMRESS